LAIMPTVTWRRRPATAWLALAALSLLACQVLAPRTATPAAATPRAARTAAAAATAPATDDTQTAPDTPTPAGHFSVGSAALSFLAPAQPRNGVQLDDSQLPFLLLFPALRAAPAPAWLTGGARVSYRVESATIPQVRGQTSASGAGYAQYDLVALEDDLAVATCKLYLDSSDGAGVVPSLSFPVLGRPGVGEFWLNPQALANAEQAASDELSVTRQDRTLAGDTYHAVRFEYTHGSAQYVWMFDVDSGLLLFFSWSIGTDADPSRQLGQMTLAARRQLALPWQGGRLPDWVAQTPRLNYAGSYATAVSGAGTVSLPATASVTMQDTGAHWNAYRLSSAIQGQGASTVEALTGGDGVFDGLWLAPEALDVLQDGQTLDTDPVTGAVIAVSRGADTVTLTETGQRYQTRLIYAASDGRLLETTQQEQIGLATTVTDLKLAGAP
jgi:hypothetical protein